MKKWFYSRSKVTQDYISALIGGLALAGFFTLMLFYQP